MYTILITGGRTYTDVDKILCAIYEYACQHSDILLVHGACKGADMLAHDVATIMNIPVKSYPVTTQDWQIHGKKAGILRNIRMFNETCPDVTLAFHHDLSQSKGTRHMIAYATLHECPVRIFT